MLRGPGPPLNQLTEAVLRPTLTGVRLGDGASIQFVALALAGAAGVQVAPGAARNRSEEATNRGEAEKKERDCCSGA
jgi:hypothetical protein